MRYVIVSDADALGEALEEALLALEGTSSSNARRSLATTEYGLDLQARRYEELAEGRMKQCRLTAESRRG